MASYRSLVALTLVVPVVLGVFAAAGCSGDDAAKPTPVTTTRPGPTTSTSAAPTTTVVAVAPTTTTTLAAPPPTKPLTTAPPSPLLDEVVAAYDAAYADLLAAGSIPDENSPALGRHIAGEQLEKWREVIRGLRVDGRHAAVTDAKSAWRRVESIVAQSATRVTLVVCRFDNVETVDRQGVVVDPSLRPFRYSEVFELEATWKWVAREWIDSTGSGSDCALPF